MIFTKTALVIGIGLLVRVSGDVPPQYDDFWFWRWGHMDGPHTSSKALGISRDGKTAVGATVVVDFQRAWRSDVDWAMSTTGGEGPPLYNELFVQEDIGIISPSRPSKAYAVSNMDPSLTETCDYDKLEENFNWCGSKPVGTYIEGRNSKSIEWLYAPLQDDFDADTDIIGIQDFGGGISDMAALDVSDDGTIMVGYGYTKRGPKGFYADLSDPETDPVVYELTIEDVDTLVKLKTSLVQAVSADGLALAGHGSLGKRGNRPFFSKVIGPDPDSTEELVLESYILPVIGGGKFAEAYAMAQSESDETVYYVAGRSDSPQGPQACIWFKDPDIDEWVVKGLGGLTHKDMTSVATGIAFRGDTDVGDLMVIGYGNSNLYDSEAFVWCGNPVLEDDEIGYMYDLEYILIKTGAASDSLMGSSWILNEATGISSVAISDAERETRIVGWGVNPERNTEAYVVTGYPDGALDMEE